jgi:hypothetical protein
VGASTSHDLMSLHGLLQGLLYLILTLVTSENLTRNFPNPCSKFYHMFPEVQIACPCKGSERIRTLTRALYCSRFQCDRQCRRAGRQGAEGPICDSVCAGGEGGETLRERDREGERVLSNA